MKKRKTAKRTYSKKKTNSSKKCKMNLREKELMALTIFAFFIFAFLLAITNTSHEGNYARVTGYAGDSNVGLPGGDSAYDNQEESEVTKAIKTTFIAEWFSKWEEGNLNAKVTKYLFFFILTGLIWAGISFVFDKKVVALLFALPISFLATAFITPNEVFAILQSYTAMGIALTFLVPFMIMIFVSAALLSNEKIKKMTLGKIILEYFLWIMFGLVLLFKTVGGIFRGDIEFTLNLATALALGSLIAIGIIIFRHEPFRDGIWRIGNKLREAKEKAIGASEAAREESRWKRAFSYEHPAKAR